MQKKKLSVYSEIELFKNIGAYWCYEKKTFCTLLFTKSIHLKEQVFRGIYYLTQSELSKPHLHPPLLLQSIWETCCFAE